MEINFQRIIAGEQIKLESEDFMKLKVHCSSLFNSLNQWLTLALTIYQIDVDQCLDLLTYVEKHEITRPIYRQHTNNNHKIRIYNCLAALYLCKDNKGNSTEEKGKLFDSAKRYINLGEKVKMPSGKTSLTLRGFIHFYEGNFPQSIGSFNRAVQNVPGDQQKPSVIGMLGLAQVFFSKRNYEGALAQYKKVLSTNKSLSAKARLGMAYCFYELQKYQMAKFCFKRLLNLLPNCIQAIIGYATIQYYEGKKDEYFSAIERCYQINPNHSLVLLHLSEHFLLSDNTQNLSLVIQKGIQQTKKMTTFVDTSDELRNDQTILKCKFNHLLGYMYHQKGQYELCMKFYNLALNKNLPYVKINLAQAYINPSNFIQAAKLIQQALKSIPSKSKRLLNQSYKTLAYIKSKVCMKKDRSDLNEAVEFYNQALKYNSKDYQSYIECANLLLQTDSKKSEQYYRLAYQILKQQNKYIHPELLNNISVLKIQKRQLQQSQRFIKLAIDQILQWKNQSNEQDELKQIKEKAFTVTFYFNLGIIYEESFRFTEAIECYKKCKQINSFYLDAYIRLAFLLFKQGNFEKSIEQLIKAQQIVVEAKNKFVFKDKILLAKAYIYKMVGDDRKAREVLKDCLNQSYKKILDQSIQYDMIIERGDSNTRNLKEMLKQKVGSGIKIIQQDFYNVYGVLFVGILAATLEKSREALLCLNAVKQMDTQHPKVLYNLGIYYYKTEEYDTALMILKKYVDKLIITDLSAELVICFIFIIKNRFEEAIRNIKRLVMLYPQNLTLRYHLVFFTQRISQKHLDAQNRQTKKISQAINYIKKIKIIYSFFSKIKPELYVSYIQNPEARQKTREQLSKIRQKSDDQKMYIKSREDRFAFYEKDAENKQRIVAQQKARILNKTKQARERQQRMIEQDQKLKEIQLEKRRQRLQKQKQLQARLNEEYLTEQKQQYNQRKQKKPRQSKGKKSGARRKKEIQYDDFIEPDPDSNDYESQRQLVEAPKRSSGGGRLKKKTRKQSSDQQRYNYQINQKQEQPQNNNQSRQVGNMEVEQAPIQDQNSSAEDKLMRQLSKD